MEVIYQICVLILVVAFGLSFIRMLMGPHAVDRVICLDLLALVTGGLIAVHSLRSGQEAFLDVVLVLSIIAFLSTVVLARLIEGYLNQKRVKND